MAAVTYADLPAGVVFAVDKNPTTGYPARPTSRSDLKGVWSGDTFPTIVASGTGGALNGDEYHKTP